MLISRCAVVYWMVTGCIRRVQSSSSEAEIVRIGAESLKISPSGPGKGDLWTIFLCVGGKKIEQRIRISARKRPHGPGLSKQQCPALTSSIESCDKHLKPRNWAPPSQPSEQKPKNDEIGQMDNRNQARRVYFS